MQSLDALEKSVAARLGGDVELARAVIADALRRLAREKTPPIGGVVKQP